VSKNLFNVTILETFLNIKKLFEGNPKEIKRNQENMKFRQLKSPSKLILIFVGYNKFSL